MKLDTRELEEKVALARKGDVTAQGWLIRQTQTRLYRFCLLLCHDPVLSQDLMQETYVRALDELGKLKEGGKFVSWLFKISRNLFLDHVKSPRNAPVEPLEDEEGQERVFGDTEAASESGPEHLIHLAQVLRELKPEDRMLLLLVDLEEYSYREAGEIIGISENNVRFRLHQIRKDFMGRYKR